MNSPKAPVTVLMSSSLSIITAKATISVLVLKQKKGGEKYAIIARGNSDSCFHTMSITGNLTD